MIGVGPKAQHPYIIEIVFCMNKLQLQKKLPALNWSLGRRPIFSLLLTSEMVEGSGPTASPMWLHGESTSAPSRAIHVEL